MSRVLRSEVLKLRTMRVTFGLLVTAVALTCLFASLEASRAGHARSGVAPLSTASGLATVTTVTGFSILLATVLGVIVASGEYRHGTATLTYLTVPDRARVLVAKAVAAAGAGALFGVTGGVVATLTGLAFVAGGGPLALGAGTLLGQIGGAALAAGLMAALGVGLGSLARSQLAGVISVFAWAVVVESVIGGLFTSARPYLPYTAATTLAGAKLGGAAFGPAHDLAGGGPLPFVAAVGLEMALVVFTGALAARTTLRADVD